MHMNNRKWRLVFLLSCLGFVAFPITPAFIGFDILLTHIQQGSDRIDHPDIILFCIHRVVGTENVCAGFSGTA